MHRLREKPIHYAPFKRGNVLTLQPFNQSPEAKFSAKGAVLSSSPPQDGFAVANLGHRLRIQFRDHGQALEARFNPTAALLIPSSGRESRFQRWRLFAILLGGAPG